MQCLLISTGMMALLVGVVVCLFVLGFSLKSIAYVLDNFFSISHSLGVWSEHPLRMRSSKASACWNQLRFWRKS